MTSTGPSPIRANKYKVIRTLATRTRVRSTGHRASRPTLPVPISLSSLDGILTEVESCVHRNLTWILFAIVGKGARRCSGGGNWSAGASVHNLSLEIGWVVPAFQRTYVISKHIRHVERGRDIAPVRPLAVRSRYQTRRARNPLRALDGRHMLRIFRRMSWRWVWG